MMEAIILAGGMGTRLKSAVPDLPKPMAPVGDTPFLDYLLDYLISSGVTHFVLAVCYKADCFSNYYGDSYKGIPIDYSVETVPLGTGGAIKKAFKYVAEDKALILNGDTFCSFNSNEMVLQFDTSGLQIMMCCKLMKEFDRYGSVELSEDRVIKFREKEHCESGYINCGVYIVNKSIFEETDNNSFSFEIEILTRNAGMIGAYITDGFFIDIGIPDDYYLAQKILPEYIN